MDFEQIAVFPNLVFSWLVVQASDFSVAFYHSVSISTVLDKIAYSLPYSELSLIIAMIIKIIYF